MRKGMLTWSFGLLVLGVIVALSPSAIASPALAPTTPIYAPDAFTVHWTQNNPSGWAIPMRLGRERNKASLWADGYGNFGLAHVRNGHVGSGKDWPTNAVMVAQTRSALEAPSGIFPDQYNAALTHYIRCREWNAFGLRVRITVEVVVDTRPLLDRLPVGIKTAWQNVEFF